MKVFRRPHFKRLLKRRLYDHQFQPILDIHSMMVFGCESLIRPKNFRSPESLFSTAMKLNKLFELDLFSITTAIQSFNNHLDRITLDTHLFLNIYPSTLVSKNFIKTFVNRIESSAIPPNRFVLEINESEHIESYSLLKEKILKLQALGVQIALDDFDKGTSPFKKILELEPNYIKLDKYLSTNLAQSVKKQKLINLFINYCSSNNIKVILEGIETDSDLSVAKSLGVDFGQGYLLGKPDKINKLFSW